MKKFSGDKTRISYEKENRNYIIHKKDGKFKMQKFLYQFFKAICILKAICTALI